MVATVVDTTVGAITAGRTTVSHALPRHIVRHLNGVLRRSAKRHRSALPRPQVHHHEDDSDDGEVPVEFACLVQATRRVLFTFYSD